ncbi:Maf family protein [Pseudohongiella sp. O18]|uniref:Maf family protein n=1 Tax=Pseudohongiella sp. O18 TaxID=2904248 RepID=UPI00398396B5
MSTSPNNALSEDGLVDLVLASASPRRRQLLEQLGVKFRVLAADIDETALAGESPTDYVSRLARQKASAVAALLADGAEAETHLPVMGADTIVVLGQRLLGKPVDGADAAQMLGSLAGREHQVITAVCLMDRERHNIAVVSTDVAFRAMSGDDIEAYVATGEPFGKAGAYAIQGLAAAFVERLCGSYTGVVGLPLYETSQLLADYAVPTELNRHTLRSQARS